MATPQGDVVDLTDDQHIDVLAQGSAWQLGDDRVITYSLYQNNVNLDVGGPFDAGVGNQTWGNSAGWVAAIQAALAVWETYANVHFVQVGVADGAFATQSTADINFSLATGEGAPYGVAGIGLFPDPAFADVFLSDPEDGLGLSRAQYPNPEGDIFFDPTHSVFNSLEPGTVGFASLLHEIGHALG